MSKAGPYRTIRPLTPGDVGLVENWLTELGRNAPF